MTDHAVAAIILAAGRSSRMAPLNKLLIAGPDGLGMAAGVAGACCASAAHDVIMVLGHQAGAVAASVCPHPKLRFVHAEGYAAGLSASLRAGLAAVRGETAAALVCLGDMPLVSAATLNRLIGAYAASAARPIVVPVWQGRRGNPVLWDRRFFAEMSEMTGDEGARALLGRHGDAILRVDAGSGAVLVDFDTPASLPAAYRAGAFG